MAPALELPIEPPATVAALARTAETIDVAVAPGWAASAWNSVCRNAACSSSWTRIGSSKAFARAPLSKPFANRLSSACAADPSEHNAITYRVSTGALRMGKSDMSLASCHQLSCTGFGRGSVPASPGAVVVMRLNAVASRDRAKHGFLSLWGRPPRPNPYCLIKRPGWGGENGCPASRRAK